MDGWRYTYKTAMLEGLKGYLDSISKPCEVTIVESQNALSGEKKTTFNMADVLREI